MKNISISAVILMLTIFECVTSSDKTNSNDEVNDLKTGLKLIYSQDFNDTSSLSDFIFTNNQQWKLSADGKNGYALEAIERNDYTPKVRSPYTIVVLKGYVVGDFVLEADLKQKPGKHECNPNHCVYCGHRDMCVFWGIKDPLHYYYSHIAYISDEIAHNVYIVNNEPRTAITQNRNEGVEWGEDEWKHIKVERNIKTGIVKVYFEDMENPVLQAVDTSFSSGLIGFGSFDESGWIDNIELWAEDSITYNPKGNFTFAN